MPASADHNAPHPVIEHAVLGCCGIAGIARLTGIGKEHLDIAEKMAADNGEGAVMCIIVEKAAQGNAGWHGSQDELVPLLQANGWERRMTWFNPNSGNELGLWAKILPMQERRGQIGYAPPPQDN